MLAPIEITSHKRSSARPANVVAARLKNFFVRFYVALDKAQRRRAAQIIQRYAYLIPDSDENSAEQQQVFLSKNQDSRKGHEHCKKF